jgi:hypothetical protein
MKAPPFEVADIAGLFDKSEITNVCDSVMGPSQDDDDNEASEHAELLWQEYW